MDRTVLKQPLIGFLKTEAWGGRVRTVPMELWTAGGSGKQAAKHPKGSRVPPAGKGGATAKSAKGASPSPTPNRAVDPEEEDKSASAGPVLAPELERKGAGGGGNNHTLAKTFVSLLAAIAATALLVLLAHAGPRMLGEWQKDRELRWQKLKRMEMGGGGPMAAREAMAGLGSPFASDCGTAGSGRSALDLFALDGLKSVRPWALWPSPPSGDEGDEEDPRGPEGGENPVPPVPPVRPLQRGVEEAKEEEKAGSASGSASAGSAR